MAARGRSERSPRVCFALLVKLLHELGLLDDEFVLLGVDGALDPEEIATRAAKYAPRTSRARDGVPPPPRLARPLRLSALRMLVGLSGGHAKGDDPERPEAVADERATGERWAFSQQKFQARLTALAVARRKAHAQTVLDKATQVAVEFVAACGVPPARRTAPPRVASAPATSSEYAKAGTAAHVALCREAELEEIRAVLNQPNDQSRALYLEDGAGVGKSCLALAIAAEPAFRQPPIVVPFAKPPKAIQTLREVTRDVMDQLRKTGPDVELRALAGALQRRVLVLDNIDSHEAAVTAGQIAQQLIGCPLIMTGRYGNFARSRETGIHRQVIKPFVDDADRLKVLSHHVGREPQDFERGAWLELVRKLGGVALAIKLAAGYLRTGGRPDHFLEDLKRHAKTSPVRDANDEFAGVQGQTIFSSLSVTLHHLRALWGSDADGFVHAFASLGHAPLDGVGSTLGRTLIGLEGLAFEKFRSSCVDHSLIEIVERPGRPPALALHPIVALFGQELGHATLGREVFARSAEWFVEHVKGPRPGARPDAGTLGRWREVWDERENLTQVLRAADPDELVRLISAGSEFAQQQGPFLAWATACGRALDAQLSPSDEAITTYTRGYILWKIGRYDEAAADGRSAMALFQKVDDAWAAMCAECILADVAEAKGGNLEYAMEVRRRVLAFAESVNDDHQRLVAIGKISDLEAKAGRWDEALNLREYQIREYVRLGESRGEAIAWTRIADWSLQRAPEAPPYAKAIATIRTRVMAKLEETDPRLFALAGRRLMDWEAARGKVQRAIEVGRDKVIPILEAKEATRDLVVARVGLAAAYRQRGTPTDVAEAERLLTLAHEEIARTDPALEDEILDRLAELADLDLQSDPHDPP